MSRRSHHDFGFPFGSRPFPLRRDSLERYLQLLKEYKQQLEEELRAVEEEIEEVKESKAVEKTPGIPKPFLKAFQDE